MQLIRRVLNRSLIQTIRRTVKVPNSEACKILYSFGLLNIQTSPGSNVADKPSETEPCLFYRIEILKEREPVLCAFQSWMGDGYPVLKTDINDTIYRLKKRKMTERALEVMEWVIREKPYKLKESDYANLLHFTISIHGIPVGEQLFASVPSEFQKDHLYNNLVIGCLEEGAVRRSLEYMKRMRDLKLQISHLIYNRLIVLHLSAGYRNSIPDVLSQMKADKVLQHVSTYNILMKVHASKHNVDGIMKVVDDMRQAIVEPSAISYCIIATAHVVARLYTAAEIYVQDIEKFATNSNWSAINVLIMLYGCLRNADKLNSIWESVQNLHDLRSRSYVLAIDAYGKIGNVERAEQIWLQMKSTKGLKHTEQINSLLSVYCRHGFVEKASKLYSEIEAHGCKPNGITYRHLALGCLKSGLVKDAEKTLEKGAELKTRKVVRYSRPWLETTLLLIDAFAVKGDVGNAEKLFEELVVAKYCKYTFVYNTLIKAYANAKIYMPDLLKRMILDGARPDSETYSLVHLIERYKE